MLFQFFLEQNVLERKSKFAIFWGVIPYILVCIYQITLSYLFTYLVTPGNRVLIEKLASLQLVKKFPAFYGT